MEERIDVTGDTVVKMSPAVLNAVLHGLEELPAKISRGALNIIEQAVREQHGRRPQPPVELSPE